MLSVQAADPMGPGVMGTFCCNWMMLDANHRVMKVVLKILT